MFKGIDQPSSLTKGGVMEARIVGWMISSVISFVVVYFIAKRKGWDPFWWCLGALVLNILIFALVIGKSRNPRR